MELLSVLSLTPISFANAAIFAPDFEKTLSSYIETSMKCHHIPGTTLAIVKGDDVWTKGYGKADISLGVDVDSKTKFNIGSLTKAFTATLLGMLLSEKGLNWTVKVTDILGSGYEFTDPYRTKELTIKDLLSHRTGLARLDFGLNPVFPKSWNRSSLCKRMKYLPEEIPIRDGYIYNNYMYMMLGHVAEKLGQDTWENLIMKRIFQPLGMNESSFLHLPTDVVKQNVAKPYMFLDGDFLNGTLEIYDLHPWEPACAILSNAEDMVKWIRFHLSLGKTESGIQILSKQLMAEMHTATTAVGESGSQTKPMYPADDIDIGYGYAWRISEYRGYRKVWHSGAIGSYRSMLWTFPYMDIGIFIGVNGPRFGDFDYYHRLVTVYFVADHLLGLKPWLNETTACSYPEPWDTQFDSVIAGPTTPYAVNNTSELEGLYVSPLFPDIEVSTNSTHVQMRSNILRGILHPFTIKDWFVYEVFYPLEYSLRGNSTTNHFNVTFNRDDVTHIVNSLTLHLDVKLKYDKVPPPQIIG